MVVDLLVLPASFLKRQSHFVFSLFPPFVRPRLHDILLYWLVHWAFSPTKQAKCKKKKERLKGDLKKKVRFLTWGNANQTNYDHNFVQNLHYLVKSITSKYWTISWKSISLWMIDTFGNIFPLQSTVAKKVGAEKVFPFLLETS